MKYQNKESTAERGSVGIYRKCTPVEPDQKRALLSFSFLLLVFIFHDGRINVREWGQIFASVKGLPGLTYGIPNRIRSLTLILPVHAIFILDQSHY